MLLLSPSQNKREWKYSPCPSFTRGTVGLMEEGKSTVSIFIEVWSNCRSFQKQNLVDWRYDKRCLELGMGMKRKAPIF
jgi:hypothetical protein